MADTRVIEMVASDDVVYTLSQRVDQNTQSSTSLVQAWAADSGDLLWNFAQAGGEPSTGGGARSSLLLDEKQRHLRVLDNSQADQSALFVLDATNGALLMQVLSSEVEDLLQPEGAQIVFLHLVQDPTSAHVLSGCVSTVITSSASCQATMMLDLKLGGLKTRAAPEPLLNFFPGFSTLATFDQLQTRVSSTASSFAAEDAIIMTSASADQVTVSAVLLASQASVSGSVSFSGAQSATPFLLAATSAPLLAVSACSSSACTAHVVDLAGGTVHLRELVACQGSSSVLSQDRAATSSELSADASCVALTSRGGPTLAAGQTCAAPAPLTLAALCSSASASSVSDTFEYTPALSAVPGGVPSSSMTRLRAAFVHRYKLIGGDERLRVLALSSSGSLLLFQKREGQVNALQWVREESLARVADSVIVDGVSSDRVAHKRVEALGGRIPSLETRLQMQFYDLQDMFMGWVAQLRLTDLLGSLQSGQKSVAADRPTLEAFGFNKVSIMFTSLCDVQTSSFSSGAVVLKGEDLGQHCLEGLKVHGLDLLSGEVLWSFEPVVVPLLPLPASAHYKLFGRLLKIRPHVHGSLGPEITLLLSVEGVDGGQTSLLTFSFNPHTGEATGAGDACVDSSSPQRMPSRAHSGLGHVTSIQLYNGDARGGQEEANTYLLVHKHARSSLDTSSADHQAPPHVSLFPPTALVKNSKQREVYTQVCAGQGAQCGSLVSYRVDFRQALSSPAGSSSSGGSGGGAPVLFPASIIGSVVFNKGEGEGEAVVAVQYPTAGDPVHSRAKVLGDDSLLIKYLNPHLVAVVTEKLHRPSSSSSLAQTEQGADVVAAAGQGAAGGISVAGGEEASPVAPSSGGQAEDQAGEHEDLVDELFVNVIDTVSAQVVHRYSILHASTRLGRASVQVSWVENNLLVSYWSNQAQRQELSSVSLFEGMVDKYGLGPFSSVKVDHPRSAFNAPAPIALQKTFILPRTVTAMHHTVTARGITNKNLLLGLGSGQLYTVDLRMLDPRRPNNKPTPAEMEEKLMQYVPFLALHPFLMLSTNSSLPPLRRILSAPSKLESTSVVLALGLDVYHTRTVPSKGFDMLASDFNKPLLSLILFGMGAAVVWLRRAYKRQQLTAGWK